MGRKLFNGEMNHFRTYTVGVGEAD